MTAVPADATDDRAERLARLEREITALVATESASSRSSAGRRVDSAGASPQMSQEEAKAKAICLRLLAAAPRPRAGLAQALARKGIPADVAERVLDHLTGLGLIDDTAYAAGFARTQQRDRALSRSALRQELRRRGLGDAEADSALSGIDEDSERGRAVALVEARVDACLVAGEQTARRRLLTMLERRGYPFDQARSVVEAALAERRGA